MPGPVSNIMDTLKGEKKSGLGGLGAGGLFPGMLVKSGMGGSPEQKYQRGMAMSFMEFCEMMGYGYGGKQATPDEERWLREQYANYMAQMGQQNADARNTANAGMLAGRGR